MEVSNLTVREYQFLEDMVGDDYFPQVIVSKGVMILKNLCLTLENNKPARLEGLYELTHAATEAFNALEEEFLENDSEIDTVARENIGADFEFIAINYGFPNADIEELIAPRNW